MHNSTLTPNSTQTHLSENKEHPSKIALRLTGQKSSPKCSTRNIPAFQPFPYPTTARLAHFQLCEFSVTLIEYGSNAELIAARGKYCS